MFDNISLFIEIVKCGSVSQAADNLYLSQSTASTRLKVLENNIGTPLFDRIGRKLVLNKNGEVFLGFAQKTMTSYVATMKTIKKHNQLSELTLSFCAGNNFNIYFLPDILRKFIKIFGDANIQIASALSDKIVENIRHSEYDFGITSSPKDTFGSNIKIDFIYEYPLYFICSPLNPLAKRKNILIKELNAYPFIINRKTSNYCKHVSSWLVSTGIEPKKQITIGAMEAIKNAIMNNLGISVLPYYMVKKELKKGGLVKIHTKDSPLLTYKFYFIHRTKHKLSQISLDFINTCREYFYSLKTTNM
jgi:DNA-binding transcriptional LysR family regulator